ncbi:preprotein translocase subunit SecE [bacterium]|nr:preprotein translocase subunit SecE [bacterium]
MKKFTKYIKNSISELKKVVWPTKKEIVKKTGQVIFVSFLVAFFLGVVDFILTKILELVVS